MVRALSFSYGENKETKDEQTVLNCFRWNMQATGVATGIEGLFCIEFYDTDLIIHVVENPKLKRGDVLRIDHENLEFEKIR